DFLESGAVGRRGGCLFWPSVRRPTGELLCAQQHPCEYFRCGSGAQDFRIQVQ
ncbi:unnamed protein product, partial [Symbiodinium microadriaticum]